MPGNELSVCATGRVVEGARVTELLEVFDGTLYPAAPGAVGVGDPVRSTAWNVTAVVVDQPLGALVFPTGSVPGVSDEVFASVEVGVAGGWEAKGEAVFTSLVERVSKGVVRPRPKVTLLPAAVAVSGCDEEAAVA